MKKFNLCNWNTKIDKFQLIKISGDCETSTDIMVGTEEEIINYLKNNFNIVYPILLFDEKGDMCENWEDARNVEIFIDEQDEYGNTSYILETMEDQARFRGKHI